MLLLLAVLVLKIALVQNVRYLTNVIVSQANASVLNVPIIVIDRLEFSFFKKRIAVQL